MSNIWPVLEITYLVLAVSWVTIILDWWNRDEKRKVAGERLKRNERPKLKDFFWGPYLAFWTLKKTRAS